MDRKGEGHGLPVRVPAKGLDLEPRAGRETSVHAVPASTMCLVAMSVPSVFWRIQERTTALQLETSPSEHLL
eukprot:3301063-Amphidinium_carterae.2